MIYADTEFGQCLYLAGGMTMNRVSPFETFKLNLGKPEWNRIEIPKNIFVPMHSRPEIIQDPVTKNIRYLIYSGQNPPVRMNEGIKICSSDFLCFDLAKTSWKRLKQKPTNVNMPGRKYHAVSFCSGFVHVCSGTDANLGMLSDFMFYD